MYGLHRLKYRITVFGVDNEILVVQEFFATPYTRQNIIDHLLSMFDGEWHSYICSLIG